jgi:hypothetical protein
MDYNGGSFGPPETYYIPSRPITNAARDCECRRKMFALTKAAFPGLKVLLPFVSVTANQTVLFPMTFVCASATIKPYDEEEGSIPVQNVFNDIGCLWDTGAQTSIMLHVKSGGEEVARGGLCFAFYPVRGLLACLSRYSHGVSLTWLERSR